MIRDAQSSNVEWNGHSWISTCSKKRKVRQRITGKQPFNINPPVSGSCSGLRGKLVKWKCPECELVLQTQSGSMSQAKDHHLKSRHPHFDVSLVKASQKPTPVIFAQAIPAEQRDLSCPICDKGIGALPNQERIRAIRHHCQVEHPEHTVKSLVNLTRKGRKNSGVSSKQLQQHAENRDKKHASHQCVMLPQETNSKDRGRMTWCKKCLSVLTKGGPKLSQLSCSDRLQRLKTNPFVKKMKRDWWNRVQLRDPAWAKEFLILTGWDQGALEDLLAPVYKNEKARIAGQKRIAKLHKAKAAEQSL